MPLSNLGIVTTYLGGGSIDDSWNWESDVTPNTGTLADNKIVSLETLVVEVNYRGSAASGSLHGRAGHRSTLLRR